jgi:hypothetical protein
MLGHNFITINSRPVHVRFVVDKVVLGPVPPSDSVLPSQYYSNSVPYSSEDKKPRNIAIRHCCCGNLRELERNVLYLFTYIYFLFFVFLLASVGLRWITSNWL